MRSAKYWITAVVGLVITIWVAHFSQSPHLGLYEDDWSFIGQPMGWTWHKTLDTALLYFRQWPQGRPLGYAAFTVLTFLGNRLGGLEGVFVLAFVLKCINTLIFFAIARRTLSPVGSFCAALAFCLFPSDTSTPMLTNAFNGGVTLLFSLGAMWLFLRGQKVAAYVVSIGSLLTYESAFLPFFAVPILERRTRGSLTRALVRHWAILLAIGGSLFWYRLHMGEEKTTDVLKEGLWDTLVRIAVAVSTGTMTTLRLFVMRPVTLWREGNRHELLVVILMAVGLFAALYFLLKGGGQPKNGDGVLRTAAAGAAMLAIAYALAISRWYYPPTMDAGRLTFTHLAAAVGSGLLCGALCSLLLDLAQNHHKSAWAAVVVASYFGVLAGFHYRVQRDFRKSWDLERHFWHSVLVKCPDMTDGTLILYEDPSYPVLPVRPLPPGHPLTYVLLNSWADPLVLSEIYSFPTTWKQPPRLFSVPEQWVNDVSAGDDQLLWQPAPPWSEKEPLPQRNVILLRGKQGSDLSRITGSIKLQSKELTLKPLDAPGAMTLPPGPLYHLVVAR